MLEVDGAFGAWVVPVELLPLAESGVAVQRPIDRTTTKHGIALRLVGIALREEETVVEVDATWAAPIVAIHGLGAMLQGQGDDRFVLIDGQGRRYEEELSRETVRHARERGAHTTAKFPPLPPDAVELTLIVPSVVVEESDATLEFTLPMEDVREVVIAV